MSGTSKNFTFGPMVSISIFVLFVVLWILYGMIPEECGRDIAACPLNGTAAPLVSGIASLKKVEFGPFEALMAALAFAGLILTLVMQQYELRLARAQTEEQTEIFNLQSFETSYYQAIDQFRTFHSEIATEIDPATQELAKLYVIGALLDKGRGERIQPLQEGVGIEVLNGKVRAVVLAHLAANYRDGQIERLGEDDPVPPESITRGQHTLLRGKQSSDLDNALEKTNKGKTDFENIGKTVLWYGGTLYALIKRVRGILKILHAQPEDRRLQYIDFLQVELKPAEMGLIALCALHQAPYGETKNEKVPSFRELVKGSGLLNDFPVGNAELLRAMVSQEEWKALVDDCGLQVVTNEKPYG